ncbi:MAG: cell division protein FtsA [Verrucomicrobia bacterium]|nr:cell division protein FtsA [Verrucomicrobiota bacterium]MBV9275215.1 cell division protein FtsA [Verrucomicrobiota bacterium]
MARDNIFAGLEIGTTKICVVVAEARHDGTLKVLGVGNAPSRGVRKGEIVDFETAKRCVHDAIVDAEERSDVEISEIYLGVTGGHIRSFNNRGVVLLEEGREEIDEQDLEDVRTNAREVSLPMEDCVLHTIIQHYYVDGQDGVLNPLGLLGRKLEADFHIVYGIRTRIQNAIRCVKELELETADVVINSFATAQAVLDKHHKQLGALVIDIGGGTTDYVVYVEGAVKQSGVIAVGGDHITNDMSIGLKIPTARAEKLKLDEGDVTLGVAFPGETIMLRDETGFAGREIEREMLNQIINVRIREIFDIVSRQIQSDLNFLGAGVFVTGGSSQLRGIDHLASEIFGTSARMTPPLPLAGVTSAFEHPQFSTALGLVKYAHLVHLDRPAGKSFFGRTIKRLSGMFRS